MYQNINTFFRLLYFDITSMAIESGRVFPFVYQVPDKVLSYPLFGSKPYILLPDGIEDHLLSFLSGDPE